MEQLEMKTVSVVRMKPKPEFYDEFVADCRERAKWWREKSPQMLKRYVACSDDEVIEISIMDDVDFVIEKQESGLRWLDERRHMLVEYNTEDRHTLPISGLIIDE